MNLSSQDVREVPADPRDRVTLAKDRRKALEHRGGSGARFDPHRDWGAIASPISLVRGSGRASAHTAETMRTAAPSAGMVEREHLVGRKCERAVTKAPTSPPHGLQQPTDQRVYAEPCLDRLLEQRGHACRHRACSLCQPARQLGPRCDVELPVRLLEVVLDGLRAYKQMLCDLPVGVPLDGKAGYLRFLRRQRL